MKQQQSLKLIRYTVWMRRPKSPDEKTNAPTENEEIALKRV